MMRVMIFALMLSQAMGAPVTEEPIVGLTRKLFELYQDAQDGDVSREAEFHDTVAKYKEAANEEHGRSLKNVPATPDNCWKSKWQKDGNNADDCYVYCATNPKINSNDEEDIKALLVESGVAEDEAETELQKALNGRKCNSKNFKNNGRTPGGLYIVCLGKDGCNSVKTACAKDQDCTMYCGYGDPACNSVTLKQQGGDGDVTLFYQKSKSINSVEVKGGAEKFKVVVNEV